MNAECEVRSAESTDFGQFERDGFQIIHSLVPPAECDWFSTELTPLFQRQFETAKARIGGVRNLLRTSPSILKFAKSQALLSLLHTAAGGVVFPVRAIFFDKTPQANWLVPWHQDLAIAVSEQIDTPGFTGWSVKDGISHVLPPAEILAGMISMRVHLDDCGPANGALKVIAGSHRAGKIPVAEIPQWAENKQTICDCQKGDALLMRPLLLHASSPSATPEHRRVLHIEYASQGLPHGLRWLEH